MKLFAKYGVSAEAPANTLPAITSAFEQGYDGFSVNVVSTKDDALILAGGPVLSKYAVNRDGSEISRKKVFNDFTYSELYAMDFGAKFSFKYVGTYACLLKEALNFARKFGMTVLVSADSSLTPKQYDKLIATLVKYKEVVIFAIDTADKFSYFSLNFPEINLAFTGEIEDDITNGFLANPDVHLITKTFDQRLGKCEKLIADDVNDYDTFELWKKIGAEIVCTRGCVKPVKNLGKLVDMHTHSVNSHDASYPVLEMCELQAKAGISYVTIADHCDTFMCTEDPDFDLYSTHMNSYYETVIADEKLGDKCTVLAGIEMGEGFWCSEASKKVLDIRPYDVIVGAVHAVKCPRSEGTLGLAQAFSQFDWKNMPDDEIAEFFDLYFDDVIKMLETVDIDIMAHLTVPLGYIIRKKGYTVDMHPYQEKIKKILQMVIDRGIVMEISIACIKSQNRFCPDRWIIELYKEMGGYLIATSTDAHDPSRVGINYDEAMKVIKEIGFKNVFYLKNRHLIQCTID